MQLECFGCLKRERLEFVDRRRKRMGREIGQIKGNEKNWRWAKWVGLVSFRLSFAAA